MASTLLELTRTSQEEIERLEQEIVNNLVDDPKTHKETILQAHTISRLIDDTNKIKEKLISIYQDKEGARKEEIESMGGQGQAIYSVFYEKLRDIKDYHRRFPDLQVEPPPEYTVSLDFNDISFSSEEGSGKYLDLHLNHQAFNNLPFMQSSSIDYLTYLSIFHKFPQKRIGKGKNYLTYLTSLFDYLVDHRKRSQPLDPIDLTVDQFDIDFNQLYEIIDKNENKNDNNNNIEANNEANNNNDNNNNNKKKNGNNNNINNNIYQVNKWVEDSSKFTTLKAINNPKYCKECCKFFNEPITSKHNKQIAHKKNTKKNQNFERNICSLEYKVYRMGQLMEEVIEQTKIYVETKLAKRYEEIQADLEMEDDVASDSESDDEEELTRRCIANYPVGWDGKPIPYWLYKLHGLGIEYKCEICGNTSYWGRRAFERHFQEWRHAYGMRCLGIPNSKHFNDIININDALAQMFLLNENKVWEKVKKDEKVKEWNPDDLEECEDSEGNVLSKKTFLDLQRQGLLDI